MGLMTCTCQHISNPNWRINENIEQIMYDVRVAVSVAHAVMVALEWKQQDGDKPIKPSELLLGMNTTYRQAIKKLNRLDEEGMVFHVADSLD